MNELVNDGMKLSKLEINISFINGLPRKWLSFFQSLINANHVRDSELASIFGKLIYEENLIDSIYETEKKKSLTTATPFSTAFFSTSIVQDFQDSLDDEKDTRSSQEYMNGLKIEFHKGALLAKSKRFFKKGTQRFSGAKATNQTYEWDEEEVSLDDNEIVKVKVLMALTDDESGVVGKESARNGEWVKIFIRKLTNSLKKLDGAEQIHNQLQSITPLPPLEKLDGAEPITGPKIIKSILNLERRWLLEDSLVELEVVVVGLIDLGVDLCHQQVVLLLEREEVEFGYHLEVMLEIEHEALMSKYWCRYGQGFLRRRHWRRQDECDDNGEDGG
ncbi:hypothetical protein Tco_0210007 [Tanacetum coccineum]